MTRVRRVGSNRMPDSQSNVWSVSSPNSISPGDILSGAPGYGGESLRESSPIITEEHMVVKEPQEAPTRAKKPKMSQSPAKPKRPRIRAVLPPDAKRIVELPAAEGINRVAINLRIPAKILNHYKSLGPRYQTKIIAVLGLFVEEGGKFIET
ncbi:MAG: hypothetical protein ACHQWV_03770 [Nitrospirales bacterium]